MPQITGKAVIRVDGEEWRTEDGAKLNPGGVTREAKVGGGKVHGFAEKTKEPELECAVYHTRDTDLTAINAIRDATVVYEDSIILKLMSSVGSREALEDIIPQSLKTLKEYDEIHQTDLLATLNAYFDCNGNARLAASSMFIHHKTMLYRLNKMSELCKINLSDSDERMHLALGIKILKLLSQQDKDR